MNLIAGVLPPHSESIFPSSLLATTFASLRCISGSGSGRRSWAVVAGPALSGATACPAQDGFRGSRGPEFSADHKHSRLLITCDFLGTVV